MIFCNNFDNFIASSTITNTGENITFPSTNIYNDTIKEPTIFIDNMVFDLGSALQVTSIAIVNPSQTVTIEANSSDSWGAPAYSYTFNPVVDPYPTVGVDVQVIDQAYRYWRITASGSTSVGHLFIGSYTDLSYANIGEFPENETTDVSSIAQGGQLYFTKGTPLRGVEFDFEGQDRDLFFEKNSDWLEKRDRPGVFAQFEDTLDNWQPFFAQMQEFENNGWNESINYTWSIRFQEVR
jgi:hypothetical protein